MLSVVGLGLSIIVLLILSSLFSGSETALTAASRTKMHTLEKEGDKKAALVNRLRLQSENLLGTILFGNNLVNVLASALTTTFFLQFFNEMGVVYATLLITFLTVVFAEFLPKSIAINNPDRIAIKIAPFINMFFVIFSPFVKIAHKMVLLVLKVFNVEVGNSYGAALGDEELRGAIDLHHDAHNNVYDKRAMLRSILDLKEVDVSEIMIHRQDVVSMDINASPKDFLDLLLQSRYSRIPLYENDPENIIGILHLRKLFRFLKQLKDEMKLNPEDLKNIMLKPWFVPETTFLVDQLQAFRERREHFAVVVDEFGSFMGIVTLEDILEEIVGQITDEYDETTQKVHLISDGSYIIAGNYTLRDLNRDLSWDLPDENAATLAGLILHEVKDIPNVGQVFDFFGYRFEILKKEGNQLTSISVRKS